MSNRTPTMFHVDYYVISKAGGKTRSNLKTGVSQINGAQSESAVMAYLRKKHPDARDITIMKLDWK